MKITFTLISTLLLCSVLTSSLLGQDYNKPAHVRSLTHTCGASHLHDKLATTHPEVIEKQKRLDEITRRIMYGNAIPSSTSRGVLYTIPVVVHVVHFTGTAVGTNENITDAQVAQGIQDLNDAYRNVGFYDPLTEADAEIEFCLASRDPLGNFTTGITRTANDALTDLDMDTEDNSLKATIAQWDPLLYCNIWLVDEICSSVPGPLDCGTAGYAYYPSSHGQPWDGIVNEARFFGSSQNNSKVHIHEMGHYLNLSHTFDSGCTNNDCTTDGDKVCDTPPDNSTAAIACVSTANSCTTDEDDTSINNPFRAVGLGGLGEQNDMHQNYMDYGFQSCQDRFTPQQATRMRTALTTTRASLLSSLGCVNPSTPAVYFDVASIDANETFVTAGGACQNYRDVTVTMNIGAAPTGDANITVNYAGTATGSGADYTGGTAPEVTFLDGNSSAQSFTIRVWDDASIEGTETIILTYSIGGTTDAVAGSFNQSLTISILDDDNLPTVAGKGMLLDEDFSGGFPAGWGQTFFACPCFGSDQVWKVGTAGLPGNSVYISEDGGTTRADNLNDIRRLALTTPSIDATAIAQEMFLEFDLDIGGDVTNDYFEIFYNINGGGWTIWQTPIHTHTGTYSATLPAAFQGNNFELALIWRSNADGSVVGAVPALDNIRIYIEGQPSLVETELSTVEVPFGPSDVVYVYNGVSNDIVAQITNLSTWDYGCTTFQIDRVGTGATMFQNADPASFPTDKTLLVTPTTNNPTGNYEIRLYYSAAEVAGWEAATGESRNDLRLFKSPNAISTNTGTAVEGVNTVRGTYSGSDYYVQSEFSTGFSGIAASTSTTTILPIDLMSFRGELVEKSVALTWQTLTETNNDFFTIERSVDGFNFEEIGIVDAGGSRTTAKTYNFIDESPVIGNNYYRIQQTDFDGTMTQASQVIVVAYNNSTSNIQIEPNPIKGGQVRLLYSLEDDDTELTATIYTIDGKALVSKPFTLQKGVNELSIDVNGLDNGIYILKTVQSRVVLNTRFIIAR